MNFGKDSHITHGTFKYFSEIPDWAKNNSKIVIEEENVPIDRDTEKIGNKKDIVLHISEKSSKIKRKCVQCKYKTYNEKYLEKHITNKHS